MTQPTNIIRTMTFCELESNLYCNAPYIVQSILSYAPREDFHSFSLVSKLFRRIALKILEQETVQSKKIHFIHIKHIHAPNHKLVQTAMKEKFGVTFSLELVKRASPNIEIITELVIRSQLKTAKTILEHPNSPIVSEALDDDLTMEEIERLKPSLLEEKASRCEKIFPEGIPLCYEELNEAQKEILHDEGADFVLFWLKKIKKMYKSIHREKNDLLNNGNNSIYNRNLYGEREKEAIVCSKEAAIKHNCSTILVVYGAEHNFKPHCDIAGFSHEEIDTAADYNIFRYDWMIFTERIRGMVCIPSDLRDGNTIGMITENSQKSIPFTKTSEGWVGSVPTNKFYKFVTISQDGAVEPEKINGTWNNTNGWRILPYRGCAQAIVGTVTF